MREGAGDEPGEVALAGQEGRLARWQGAEHLRAEQRLDRVVAEEGGEQAADRWQVGDPAGDLGRHAVAGQPAQQRLRQGGGEPGDRKSTRLNSSHSSISYAVFCLKKKKITL